MSHVPFPLHAKLYIIKVYRHVESYPVPYLRIICITCILPRPRAGGGAWAGVSQICLRCQIIRIIRATTHAPR